MSSAAASDRFSADLLLPPGGDPSLVSPNLQARENGVVASNGVSSDAQALLDDISAHLLGILWRFLQDQAFEACERT